MASCPKCPGSGLKHTLLLENLPAHGCSRCDGLLLSLVVYRHWRETLSPMLSNEPVKIEKVEVDDTEGSLMCPKCRALMTKYRFSSEVPNKLDFCAHCEELWFDAGEWGLAQAIAKSGHLAEVFGQPWQRKIRKEISDEMETKRLRNLLGVDFEKFAEFRNWFESHPQRSRLLALLSRKRPKL